MILPQKPFAFRIMRRSPRSKKPELEHCLPRERSLLPRESLMTRFAYLKACVIVLGAFFVPLRAASAHPHVWVTVETEVVMDASHAITGFRHKWTFDEFYSVFAVTGLDTNGDGFYSEEELKPLAQTNVEALKEFDYFTFVFDGKTKLPLKEPANYRLEYKDKLLTLYFDLDLAAPIPRDKIKDFSFAIYDPGMYVAMTFVKNAPVKIRSAEPAQCQVHVGSRPSGKEAATAQLGEDTDPSSNIGMEFAERVTLDCK